MIPNAYRMFNFDLGETADAIRETVFAFSSKEIAPRAAEIDKSNQFPRDLWPKIGALGLHGITVEEEYGGTGLGYLEHCIAVEEMSRASAAVGLSYGAHSNLCVNQIRRNGNDAQKRKYLPKLISGEHVGSLAMSEPNSGSDVVSMATRAEKKGDRFVLNGSKMWITNGGIAQIAIVWAKLDGRIRGFIVEQGTPGYSTRDIHGKFSLRASVTSELSFQDCRIPADSILPNVEGLKGPLGCLNQARYGIAWGGLGAAMACFHEAVEYSKTRIQFDRPIAGFQMVQEKLAWMIREITKGQLLALQLGRLKDAGRIKPHQVSLGKMNNVDVALRCARLTREILGASGITDEYQCGRHMCNLESVYTYEGTHDIHTLVLGEAVTGIAAYK
jgi:isovaleryl-CoA dehydrogenase